METEYPHLLTLRVMRLYNSNSKPSLPSLSAGGVNLQRSFGSIPTPIKLPDSFGNIYSSQDFRSYVIVSNGTRHEKKREYLVARRVQVEIRMSSERKQDVVLMNSEDNPKNHRGKSNPETLSPGDHIDMIVKHNLKSAGKHTLSVTVRYDDPRLVGTGRDSQQRAFKKLYRFNVVQALKIFDCQQYLTGSDELIQFKVQNCLKSEVCIDEVTIKVTPGSGDAADDVQISEISSAHVSPMPTSILSVSCAESAAVLCRNQLQPNAVRQFLFKSRHNRPGLELGVACIKWRSPAGIRGEMEIFPPIVGKIPALAPLHLTLNFETTRLSLGVPCLATVSLTNHTKHSVKARLFAREQFVTGLAFIGLTAFGLETVAAGATVSASLTMLPLAAGLLTVKKAAIMVVDKEHGNESTLIKDVLVNAFTT